MRQQLQKQQIFPASGRISGFESMIYPAFYKIGISSEDLILSSHNSEYADSLTFILSNMDKFRLNNLLIEKNQTLESLFNKIGTVFLSEMGNSMLSIRIDSHKFN